MDFGTLHFDAVIVGGGPAGCACASWLDMLGLRCALVERRDRLGGLQNDSPYPNAWIPVVPRDWTGERVARALAEDIASREVAVFSEAPVLGIERAGRAIEVTVPDARLRARALVLATGVRPRSGGLRAGTQVLIGPGARVAATDFQGRRVAVLGGGDNAFENALFAQQRGAASMTVFARRVRARRAFVQRLSPMQVHVGTPAVDAQAMTVNGEPFDVLLVMYGWQPRLPVLGMLRPVRDADGFVATDAHCHTSEPGVWAVGELARRAHPCCLTAMADGVVAAKAIQQALEREDDGAYGLPVAVGRHPCLQDNPG